MAKQVTVSVGRPYGHVAGHQYLDVDLQAVDCTATLTITWGAAQERDEQHGCEEYTRRADSIESAIEAVRDAALVAITRSEDQQGEIRRYVETAASRALAACTKPYVMSLAEALSWAAEASAGDYLVQYDALAQVAERDPGAGYSDAEIARIKSALGKRGLTLEADDHGLRAVEAS